MPRDYSAMAKLAMKSWEANGRKPRGFSAMTPEQRRAATAKSHAARKRNRKENAASAAQDE